MGGVTEGEGRYDLRDLQFEDFYIEAFVETAQNNIRQHANVGRRGGKQGLFCVSGPRVVGPVFDANIASLAALNVDPINEQGKLPTLLLAVLLR